MVTVCSWMVLALALAPSLASGYLLLLTVLSGRRPAPSGGSAGTRFDVVVPAHDEEGGIGATVASLLAVEYPRNLFRVVVVADNCGDRTAEVAAAAGAQVLVRDDPARPGKGRALAYAFERSLAEGWDAVVVVDADSIVSPNLLAVLDSRVQQCASAVQCDYGVRNPDASWRTLLMTVALGSFHRLRSLGRERLRLSCGLRGNGMCFTAGLLRQVPHDAFSVVEDLEYGLRLGEAGFRVVYAPEAHVLGEMVATEGASRSQRRRWERGRAAMRARGRSLLLRGVRSRDPVLVDLALDVLIPPLSTLLLAVVAGSAMSVGVVLLAPTRGAALLVPWVFSLASVGLYLFRGWQLSATGARGLLALLHVPGYLAWKLALGLRRDPGHGRWIRTARERSASSL